MTLRASSQFGISGNVALDTPEVDPNRGLVELPADVLDRSNQIAQTCTSRVVAASSFTNSGRGSLPPSPMDTLQGETSSSELASLGANVSHENSSPSTADPSIEAQGWIKDAQGNVSLVANTSTSYPVTLGHCN